jgi:predicted nucleotidyltransferase
MKTELISELTNILKQKFSKDLLSVVLFGSRVKGNFTTTSDIDVLVVCESPENDWRARDEMILDLTEDIELKYIHSWRAEKIEEGVSKIPGLAVIESG